MGRKAKLSAEISRFIISRKHKFPEISCRKLTQEANQKFGISLSKSSVNNLIKRERLSSPIGRRSKQIIDLEKELEHGGFFILLCLDYLLNLSKTASDVLEKLIPASHVVKSKDIQSVMQAFIIFKSLYDVTLDTTACYNNSEIWALLGYRPTRAAYKRVLEMLDNSQLFAEQLVIELRLRLKPVSGFNFVLSDAHNFFVDAQLQSVWQSPKLASKSFYTTYYNIDRYINMFSEQNVILSIFNAQGASIFSPEVLDLVLSLNSELSSKRLTHIEILDLNHNVLERKFIFGSQKRFFLLGFWPWQLDIMYELERKTAQHKLSLTQISREFYYQIEEISLPQHIDKQRVKLLALILRNSPQGAAKIALLTNMPEEILLKHLSLKELYHWIEPEEKYKIFTQSLKNPITKNLSSFLWLGQMEKENQKESLWEKIFEILSRILFQYFHYTFVPQVCQNWNPLKIKDVFLRQKAVIQRGKRVIIHNSLISNELCKPEYMKHICLQLNNLGIKDEQERLVWFK